MAARDKRFKDSSSNHCSIICPCLDASCLGVVVEADLEAVESSHKLRGFVRRTCLLSIVYHQFTTRDVLQLYDFKSDLSIKCNRIRSNLIISQLFLLHRVEKFSNYKFTVWLRICSNAVVYKFTIAARLHISGHS